MSFIISLETLCQITVPRQGSKDAFITIKGFTKKSITSAKNRLDMIVTAARSKHQFTHFLSIAFEGVCENFLKFQQIILNDPEIHGIDKSLFQLPQKLHLTISTLALLDNEDRLFASEVIYVILLRALKAYTNF